jgi:hypothetical protein
MTAEEGKHGRKDLPSTPKAKVVRSNRIGCARFFNDLADNPAPLPSIGVARSTRHGDVEMHHVLAAAEFRVEVDRGIVAVIGLDEDDIGPREAAMRRSPSISAVAMPWRRCAAATARS